MDEPVVNVAVIYYSATGTVFALVKAAASAAEKAGAQVRLPKVRELAPDEAIASNEGWAAHAAATQYVVEASLEDLKWADALLLGHPHPVRHAHRPDEAVHRHHRLPVEPGPADQQDRVVVHRERDASRRTGEHDPRHEQHLLPLELDHRAPRLRRPRPVSGGQPVRCSHTSRNGTIPPGEVQLAAMEFHAKRVVEIAATFLRGRLP
jgi:NAD(P)H dehydrogenase (quinone)